MRLHKVEDTHGQKVSCYGCGKRSLLNTCHADLDGKAFKAYYCPKCTQELNNGTRKPKA